MLTPAEREAREPQDHAHTELLELADILATALAWIGQSAGSPLSTVDVRMLLQRIDKLRDRE